MPRPPWRCLPTGSCFLPATGRSHWIYGYLVGLDGSLRYGQRFYWLHVSESNDGTPDSSGASAMAVDRDGNLYVATRMGVQVADRNGRVRAILTLPEGGVTSFVSAEPISIPYISFATAGFINGR